MLKITKIFIFFFLSSTFLLVNSYYEKVEDVFLDIDSNYRYYSELQNLYDNGVIYPDENGKFNPNKLLTRDEFVGIVMEVSCKKCVKPNTAIDYIMKYTGKNIFFDLEETNKNFYCIAEAKETDVVRGYNISHKCEDGTTKEGYSPFCVNNNITIEEALAVLLRNSSVFTINDNNVILSQIAAGTITQDLAKDLKPKNPDGTPYTFYGYFKKALDLSYSEYDLYGNLKKYSLISIDSNGNLNPKKYVSKEEFLRMSYIVSKLNSCSLGTKNIAKNTQIAGKIDIYDKECNIGDKNCKKSDLKDKEGIYDFDADIKTTCDKGIKDYIWEFYNKNTGELYTKKGKYLDNYKFESYGMWQIKLVVIDNCGKQAELYNEISYLDESKIKTGDNNLGVSVDANPMFGQGQLKVDFKSIVKNCNNCKYEWNFGDGNKSNLKNPSNVFLYPGVYDVELVIIDENQNKARATLSIRVDNNYNDLKDYLGNINIVKNAEPTGKIDIYDKECNIGDKNCKKSDLKDKEGIYDFDADIKTTCDKGIKDYIWEFYNKNTGELYTKKGKYLDNYKFESYGMWQIKLVVIDNCGKQAELYNEISYLDESKIKTGDNNLGVSVDANPMFGQGQLKVDFKSIVKNCNNCKYEWNFGDGNKSNLKNPSNVFLYPGVYDVELVIIDENQNKARATLSIRVDNNYNDLKDYLGNINIVKNAEPTGKIDIYDKECNIGDKNCKKSDLKDKEGIYDFDADIKTTCDKGIKDYIWEFYNKNTGELYTKKGKYLDNYKFESYGMWQIKLVVIDNCGKQAELYNEISYLDESKIKTGDNNLGVSVDANPMFGQGQLKVDFKSIVKNCNNCKYEWNFGDGNKSNLKNPSNVFLYPGVYNVELVIIDENQNKARATLSIRVDNNYNDYNSYIDTDGDGVFDKEDKCILIKGDTKNNGCPILDETCVPNTEINTCKSGYICNSSGICEVKKESQSLLDSCIYPSNGSSVFGNVICNTCPCDYSISFLSSLRKCDTIFPAITSPDKKEIYGHGEPYQIPYYK